jgi:hypothetical protein
MSFKVVKFLASLRSPLFLYQQNSYEAVLPTEPNIFFPRQSGEKNSLYVSKDSAKKQFIRIERFR